MSISESEVIIGPTERSVGLLLLNVVAGPQRTTPYCQKRSVHRDHQEKPKHPIVPDGNLEPPKESGRGPCAHGVSPDGFLKHSALARGDVRIHQCLFRTGVMRCRYSVPSGANGDAGRVVAQTCKLCAQLVLEWSHEGSQ